jgi:hypothetical protein
VGIHGTRIAGRMGESVGVSEFVWGTRVFVWGTREAEMAAAFEHRARTRSRQPPTQTAFRWSLPLTLPLTGTACRAPPSW